VVVADQGKPAARVGVVRLAGRLIVAVVPVVAVGVGNLLGQPLVERLVVLRVDPLVGRIDHLVAVVVADLVGVEFLLRRERIVVEAVSRHRPIVPDGATLTRCGAPNGSPATSTARRWSPPGCSNDAAPRSWSIRNMRRRDFRPTRSWR